MMKLIAYICLPLLALAAGAAAPIEAAGPIDDYPTTARVDYVLGCMNVNGGTEDAVRRCSCSIDVIATILPYAQYEAADTVLRMRQGAGGYLAEEFRSAPSTAMVRDLREAQAEAEVRCF